MASQLISLEGLRRWFLQYKRPLPWRSEPTPYAVWVSEVMLQQTQAAVVTPYYKKWMERFPTPHALSEASLDEVIKVWEGLGYYSRARNLHAGAQIIVDQFDGNLPTTADELHKIKGVGEYTVGAILSFAFHEKAAAVDGNVVRVISRLYGIADDTCKPATKRAITRKVEELLPDNAPWEVMEGLIELGATVCKPKPVCEECPLQQNCVAYATNRQSELPVKGSKIKYEKLIRTVALVVADDYILVRKGSEGVMADLYEFPYVDGEVAVAELPFEGEPQMKLPPVDSTFTRYRVRHHPWVIHGLKRDYPDYPDYQWVSLDQLSSLPFSSGHRKIRISYERTR